MRFLQIPTFKIFFILSFLFLSNNSEGNFFYENLLENHKQFLEKHFKNKNAHKEILSGFPHISLSDLEDRYVGYSEIIKLLRDLSSLDAPTRKKAQKRLDEMLFKINSSSDPSSIELVRIFIGVFLYSTNEDTTVWNNASAFLSRIQNRRIVFFEIEQELLSILFFPHANAHLRIMAAKALGRLRPRHPYIPDQLLEVLYKSWKKINMDTRNNTDEARVLIEVAKALIEIKPGKLIDALYYTDMVKPDTIESNVVTFPVPVDPREEQLYKNAQFLKGQLLETVLGRSESKPAKTLSARESNIRGAAEYALHNIQSDHPDIYLPLVHNLIFNKDFNIRRQAAHILVYFNPLRMADTLYAALSDPKKEIRIGGIRAAKEVSLYLLFPWYRFSFVNNWNYFLSFLGTHDLLKILDKNINGNNWRTDFTNVLSHSNIKIRIAAFILFFEKIISQQLINSLSYSDLDIRDKAVNALKDINPRQMMKSLSQSEIRRGISREVIFRCYNAFNPKSASGVQ